jgi:hypothetical protein
MLNFGKKKGGQFFAPFLKWDMPGINVIRSEQMRHARDKCDTLGTNEACPG